MRRSPLSPEAHEYRTEALWIRIPQEATAGLDELELDHSLFTAAKALIKFLASPAAAPVIRKCGMEPVANSIE